MVKTFLKNNRPESIQALLEVPQQSYEAQFKVRNLFILKDEIKEDKEVEDYFVKQGKERERNYKEATYSQALEFFEQKDRETDPS